MALLNLFIAQVFLIVSRCLDIVTSDLAGIPARRFASFVAIWAFDILDLISSVLI